MTHPDDVTATTASLVDGFFRGRFDAVATAVVTWFASNSLRARHITWRPARYVARTEYQPPIRRRGDRTHDRRSKLPPPKRYLQVPTTCSSVEIHKCPYRRLFGRTAACPLSECDIYPRWVPAFVGTPTTGNKIVGSWPHGGIPARRPHIDQQFIALLQAQITNRERRGDGASKTAGRRVNPERLSYEAHRIRV